MLVEVVKVTVSGVGGVVSVTSLGVGVLGSGSMEVLKLVEVFCTGVIVAEWSGLGFGCSFRMRSGEGLSSGEVRADVVERGEEMAIGGPSGRIRKGVRYDMEWCLGRGVGVPGVEKAGVVGECCNIRLFGERSCSTSSGSGRILRAAA